MWITASQGDGRGVDPGAAHVAVLVENVSLADDNRLRKQVGVLLDAGYRVSVVTKRDPANEAFRHLPGLRLVEYPAPPEGASTLGHLREYVLSLAWQVPALARLHRNDPIDVLQLCQPPDMYFPLAKVLRGLGTRVLLDQRDLMPETLLQRYDTVPSGPLKVLSWFERQTQRNVDHSVTVNGYLRDRLVASGGAPDRVSLVYNGPIQSRVDAGLADPMPRGGHRYLVCWAGKMGKQDRVDQVLRVAHHVVHDLGRRDCGFLLLGNGECLEELRALTVELDLEPWVDFPGWLPEVDLYRYLASCDVGLDTSLQEEVTPVKAMEYMGVGLPVLAFDVEQTRVLIDGAGVRVTPDDTTVLAKELVSLLDSPEERRRLGEAGRRKVQETLAWERQADEYLAVVGRLAEGSRRRAARR
jgi:glycosyltransferase involved in cell wall biosynthesis